MGAQNRSERLAPGPKRGLQLMLAINQASVQRSGQNRVDGPRYLAISEYWQSAAVHSFRLECPNYVGGIGVAASGGDRSQIFYISHDSLRWVVTSRIGYPHERPRPVAVTRESREGLQLSGLDLVDYSRVTTTSQLEQAHLDRLNVAGGAYSRLEYDVLQDFYDRLLQAATAASRDGARLALG